MTEKPVKLKDYLELTCQMLGVNLKRLDGIDVEKEYELILAKESRLPARLRMVIDVAIKAFRARLTEASWMP